MVDIYNNIHTSSVSLRSRHFTSCQLYSRKANTNAMIFVTSKYNSCTATNHDISKSYVVQNISTLLTFCPHMNAISSFIHHPVSILLLHLVHIMTSILYYAYYLTYLDLDMLYAYYCSIPQYSNSRRTRKCLMVQ